MMLLAINMVTIPDLDTGRALFQLGDLNDNDTAKALFHLHKQLQGHRRLANTLQRIVLITGVLKRDDQTLETYFFGGPLEGETNAQTREFKVLDAFYRFVAKNPVKLVFEQAQASYELINTRSIAWRVKQMAHSPFNPDILAPAIDLSQQPTLNLNDHLGAIHLVELATIMGLKIQPDMSLTKRWEAWHQHHYEALNNASLQTTLMLYQLGVLLENKQGHYSDQQLHTTLNVLKPLIGN